MKSISEILKDYKEPEKVLNSRQEIIKKFVDKLNSERGTYKPLSPSFVASKMYDAGLKTNFHLWWFWGYLSDVKSFSKTWWYSLDYKNSKEFKSVL